MIGLAVMLGSCSLPVPPRAGSATDASLLLAQSRWQARHPARYRLVVQEDTDDHSCRQAVEVQDERVQAILGDDCGRATPWTVSSLLDWIGSRAQASSTGTTASLVYFCQIYNSARAVYDPKLATRTQPPISGHSRRTGLTYGHCNSFSARASYQIAEMPPAVPMARLRLESSRSRSCPNIIR